MRQNAQARQFTYLEADLGEFVSALPYLQLIKPHSAYSLLADAVAKGNESGVYLPHFPEIALPELDLHYRSASAIKNLHAEIITDLIGLDGFRGRTIAAFLICVSGHETLASLLPGPVDQPSDWIIAVAKSEAKGKTDENWSKQQTLLQQLRAQVAEVTQAVPLRLRRAPVGEDAIELDHEREVIAEAYRTGGADAARALIEKSKWKQYLAQ